MVKRVTISTPAPQFCTITNLTYAQENAWFGHTMQDLKMDLIYPEDASKKYPCIVWICGGAWLEVDKSAHLAYLSDLARRGFVVASLQYLLSNEAKMPKQLQEVKAGIRYLRAHAERFHIDTEHFGVMGESAGGYLTCMAALATDSSYDVGDYLTYSSQVQAACPWYPPTDFDSFPRASEAESAASPESLLLGMNVATHMKEAAALSPTSFVTKTAPPFLFIHGTADMTVPFSQSEILYQKLQDVGCDATLVAIEGANHADKQFFQKETWDMIAEFFKEKLR